MATLSGPDILYIICGNGYFYQEVTYWFQFSITAVLKVENLRG